MTQRLRLALLLSLSAVCLSWAGLHAQTITQIAPAPSQWNLWSACFLDAQKGFVCGDMMTFAKTLDGGATWTPITLPGWHSDPLYNVTFLDANVGIVCGNSSGLGPDVYRTTDGGNTWTRVTAFPLGGSWYHQDYVDSTTGFIGSNGALVRTTDAGATFQVRSGYPACPFMTGMDFIDANVGFASGGVPPQTSGLFKTTDGGLTWTHKLSGACNDVIYLSPNELIAVLDTNIVRSTDGGDNWNTLYSGLSTGIADLERVSATTIVGVSASGDIWTTTDGGFSWTQTWIGEGDLPGNWSVDFADALNGTVAGVRGLLYATHDGGLTWSRLNRGAAFEGNGITALSNDTIVTVGYHGFAQRLTVGGDWNLALVDPPTFGRNTSFHSVASVGTDFVYAAGSWGGLAKSFDGGRNWQNLVGAVSLLFTANEVEFTDQFNGWMTGFDYSQTPAPVTFTTTDGGDSWQEVTSGVYPGVAVEVFGQNVWIQSGVQTQWHSSNGGVCFVTRQLPDNSGSPPSVADLSFEDALPGYACGYDGYLAKTTDGGQTWSQLGSVQLNTHILGVLATNQEVWICGGRGGGGFAFVRRSLDGGSTWTTWNFGGQYTTPYQLARAGSRLFVSGYNGETWMIGGLPDYSTAVVGFCFGDGTGTSCPCGNNGSSGSGCANSAYSAGARLVASGQPRVSASGDTFALTAMRLSGPGLFMQSTALNPGFAFGDGLLCASGTLSRMGVVFPLDGSATFPPSAASTPIHVAGAPLSAGDVRHYQCWYRDALAFCTPASFNMTNGLSVQWLP